VAVNGRDALQLWMALAQPVSLAQARAFLDGLVARYLPACRPPVAGLAGGGCGAAGWRGPCGGHPGRAAGGECWSAFVSPDLAPVFAETPWLDIPPRDEAQAALLRGLSPIGPAAWAEAMAQLTPPRSRLSRLKPRPQLPPSPRPPAWGPARTSRTPAPSCRR
jgi:hypothetical protein